MHDKSGKLCALVSTHVDDLKCTGDKQVLEALQRSLEGQFGKCSVQWDDFVHCGIKHTRKTDGTVTIDQNHYGHQIQQIKTFKTVTQPVKDSSEKKLIILDPARQHEFHSCVGALGWITNTRTDIMSRISELQSKLNKANSEDVKKLNSLISWLHKHDLTITFKPIKAPYKLLCINDAAFNTDSKGRSIRGSLLFLAHDDPKNIGGTVHELSKACKTIKRVCRSTFAAELQAACGGLDEAQFAALLLHELYSPAKTTTNNTLAVRQQWSELRRSFDAGKTIVPIDLLTDCRSLYDSVINLEDKKSTETNLFIHLQCLRQDFRQGRVRKFIWCSTGDMIADGLTKTSVNRDAIRNCLTSGTLKLYEPPMISTSRHRVPTKQKPKKKFPKKRK